MPAEQFERTIEVNLLGAYKTLRATAPSVIERKGYLLTIVLGLGADARAC